MGVKYNVMMRSFPVIVTLLLSFLTLPAHSAESEEGRWKLFGKSMTDTRWYMDTATVTHPGENIVAVWVKSIPDKINTRETEEPEETEAILKRIQEKYFGDYDYTQGLWELECSKFLFRLLYFCAYHRNGDILISRVTPDAEWSSILPGSAGEALHGIVCSAR